MLMEILVWAKQKGIDVDLCKSLEISTIIKTCFWWSDHVQDFSINRDRIYLSRADLIFDILKYSRIKERLKTRTILLFIKICKFLSFICVYSITFIDWAKDVLNFAHYKVTMSQNMLIFYRKRFHSSKKNSKLEVLAMTENWLAKNWSKKPDTRYLCVFLALWNCRREVWNWNGMESPNQEDLCKSMHDIAPRMFAFLDIYFMLQAKKRHSWMCISIILPLFWA